MVITRLFEFVSMDFLGFRRKYYSELVRERWDRLVLCGGEGRGGEGVGMLRGGMLVHIYVLRILYIIVECGSQMQDWGNVEIGLID